MCRRYVSPDEVTVEKEFDLVPSDWEFPFNFNAAPSQVVPVIRVVEGQPDPVLLTWGFGDHGTFTVSVEMLDLAGGERSLLAQGQRCIVPAMGFYEWRAGPSGRQPFYIHAQDQDVFGFAGLWEGDRFTLITVPANPLVAGIDVADRRMPAILPLDARDVWLYGSATNAGKALGTYPADAMVAYKVTARVDSLSNNDETLIEPLETDVD